MTRFALRATASLLVLLPLAASAQNLAGGSSGTFDCASIANVKPVSEYTKKVLERADRALSYAGSGGGGGDSFTNYLPGWTRAVESAAVSLVDAGMTVDNTRGLRDATACLRLDLVQIECKIEQVRLKLNDALSAGSSVQLYKLRALMKFLAERHHALAVGARQQFYEDVEWGKTYVFDPPASGYCCKTDDDSDYVCEATSSKECGDEPFYETLDACTDAGCTAPSGSGDAEKKDRMCPFSTNYLPAQFNGFGCDEQLMAEYTGYSALAVEQRALQDLVQKVGDLQREVSSAIGSDSVSTAPIVPADERERQTPLEGCGAKVGVCSGNENASCSTDNDCSKTSAGRCIFEQGVCALDPTKTCMRAYDCYVTASSASASVTSSEGEADSSASADDESDVIDTCLRGTQPTPAFWELRGPFSFGTDWLRLLPIFGKLREAQGEAREQADIFKLPAEQGSSANSSTTLGGPLQQIIKAGGREVFRLWNKVAGQEEAAMYPLDDGAPNPNDELGPFRQAIARLARLASLPNGTRSLANSFVYWLLRTCDSGPCAERLAVISKILLSQGQECFPYVSGIFEKDRCATSGDISRAEKCAKAAGIEGDLAGIFPDCSEPATPTLGIGGGN